MHHFRSALIRIVAKIILIGMTVLWIPSPVLAFDFSLRDFFRQKVETSDRFTNSINSKADGVK